MKFIKLTDGSLQPLNDLLATYIEKGEYERISALIDKYSRSGVSEMAQGSLASIMETKQNKNHRNS